MLETWSTQRPRPRVLHGHSRKASRSELECVAHAQVYIDGEARRVEDCRDTRIEL